ncbi:MAG: transglutaminase domain-containing protein [Candidatus Helarchaeota archaeon]
MAVSEPATATGWPTAAKAIVLFLIFTTVMFGTTTYLFYQRSEEYWETYNQWMALANDYRDFLDDINETITQDMYFYQTIEYHKNFGSASYTLRMQIPYVGYFLYKFFYPHEPPSLLHWDDWADFCTPDDWFINYTAHYITQGLTNQEEIVDTVLNFVQDKGEFVACMHYISEGCEFPKYPIETLVEGGGDCEDHAILYASLMKALGFQIVLLVSYTAGHMLCGVHLDSPPTHHSQFPTYWYKDYDSVRYYTAETTSEGWFVGDLPPSMQGESVLVVPI